jgi:glycosyltransferase involved in cell wall biosynthesis
MLNNFSILHLSTGKSLRGGERQVMFLHNGLLKKAVQSVLLCKAGNELARQPLRGIQPIPWHGEADLFGFIGIYNRCKKMAPRIIHCHDAHALVHGSIVGALLKIPIIYSRRVIFPLHNDPISRWKYGQCAAIIAVSNAVAKQCAESMPSEKIHIVHDGVDWNTPLLSRGEARKVLGVSDNCFLIGTVGHFTGEKNLSLTIELAQALRSSYPQVKIVCIGDADFRGMPLPDNFLAIGPKPNAVSFYNAFDLYISTSTREGLGSALIDAVVRDIPAVATDAGGTRDIFPEHWPLVPQKSSDLFITAVKHAIDDYEKVKSDALLCGKRARDIFSIQSLVENTIAIYQRILSGAGPSS